MSLELRAPFAATLNSDIVSGAGAEVGHAEFGNVTLTGKALLWQADTWAVSAGLQLALPTADNTRILRADRSPLVLIKNQSVHLMPLIGGVYAPNERFFAQGFVQFGFDANGNSVSIDSAGQGLDLIGRINEPSYLYANINVGWWLLDSGPSDNLLTNAAPMIELHYNRSLQRTDVVSRPGFEIGQRDANYEVLNLVVGGTVELRYNSFITLGYTAPLAGGVDKPFDGELRAFFTQRLGG